MGKIAKMTDVSGLATIDQVLAVSHTNFTTTLAPIQVAGFDVDGHRAIVRSDSGAVLGVTGERFRANDHIAHLQDLQPLVSSGFLEPAHVAVWDNGARMAFQFRVRELDLAIREGDTVSPLLTLAFGLDGSFSDRTFLAKFRWFCKNQMGAVREATGGVSVRHVGRNVERYADLVSARVASLTGKVREEEGHMRRMLSAPLKGRELLGYFATAIGADDVPAVVTEVRNNGKTPEKLRGPARVVRSIVDDYRADDGGAPNTVWHAYNGITRYVTHSEGRNEATRSARALLGSAAIDRAWENAIQIAA